MNNNSENHRRYRPWLGWSFFFIVLIFGLLLATFSVGIGAAASVRIPFTPSNLSVGGSLGKKEVAEQVLPGYLRNRVADNSNFFNHSSTMTIWLAEGIGMIVLGNQPEAPVVDLNFNLVR